MKLRQSPMGEGLDTYVSHKHTHPLHSLISVIEALLMLIGVVVLILVCYQGSFSKAGQTVDNLIGTVTHSVSGMAAPKPVAKQ